MLDNGCYEYGYPLPYDDLIALAREVKADEIVAPDFFRQREATFEATKEFLETVDPKKLGFNVCVVPQAKSPLEWIEAYKDMVKLEIDVVSLPIWLHKYYKARPSVFGYLLKKGLFDETKEWHLLGLDGIGELYAYPKDVIRSVDTSLPFSLANANVWETCFGNSKHQRIAMDRERFAPMQEKLLMKHIKELKEAASYV